MPKYASNSIQKGLDFINQHGLTDVHKLLLDLVGANKHVLEIGCASGYLSEAMFQRGCIVEGVELDPELAESARHHCQRVITGNIEDVNTQERIRGTFQVILMADVIEHLQDPASVIAHLKEHLGPNGIFIITAPNIAFYKVRQQILKGEFTYTDFGILDRTHLRFFTYYTFKEFLETCDLRILKYLISESRIPFERFIQKMRMSWVREAFLKRRPNLVASHMTAVARPMQRVRV